MNPDMHDFGTDETELENWIVDFADKIETHDDWLKFIRFGLPTLKSKQSLFVELLTDEATRINDSENLEARTISDDCARIFNELNLRLEIPN